MHTDHILSRTMGTLPKMNLTISIHFLICADSTNTLYLWLMGE